MCCASVTLSARLMSRPGWWWLLLVPGTMLDWAGGRSSGRSKLWLMSHRGRGDTIKKSYSPFLEITFILLSLKYIKVVLNDNRF